MCMCVYLIYLNPPRKVSFNKALSLSLRFLHVYYMRNALVSAIIVATCN